MKARNESAKRFEQLILPHLNAAHNLARWLLKDAVAAQDVVQDSALRAFAAIDRFSDGNSRAWFLTIVRNQCYTWLKASGSKHHIDIDDETSLNEQDMLAVSHSETPEKLVAKMQDAAVMQKALETLPVIFREVIILKELEEMSYKEIASVTEVPIGTVMSRLARGREMLKKELLAKL